MAKKKETPKVLSGKLPSEEGTVIADSGDGIPKVNIPESIRESIENDWDVEILLEEHPEYEGKVFVIKMKSTGGTTKPVFFLPSDLYDQKSQKKIIRELVNRGRFVPDEIQALIEYVDCLKVAGPTVISTDNGHYKQHIAETSDSVDANTVEKVYNMIIEHVIDNRSVFPDRSCNSFKKDDCHGAILDDRAARKKYGGLTVAIVETHLQEIVGVRNTKMLNAVLNELANRGLYHLGASETRRKVTLAERCVMNAHVFKIEESLLLEGVN
ncbi:hypothetical protein PCCS19_20920 [Paenibacillus sp. CCS19]|uniref:hypothetical protein n=1 Tax=Paenibacillus sp. CCS19 TaxID=3158387 RepID=UPI002566F2F6|nr:hypothetical protein [Paenibacillus cellulosilyticus]GMK39038.1 hypothetical protein PCCS19_20920 [Paenibacillus cellulosilyticus]